jgi:hypothetical protein
VDRLDSYPHRVPPGTARARVHTVIVRPAPIVDSGAVVADLRCVAGLLRVPSAREATILGKSSTQWRIWRR